MVPESNTHRPIPALWFTPSCGTLGEDFDDPVYYHQMVWSVWQKRRELWTHWRKMATHWGLSIGTHTACSNIPWPVEDVWRHPGTILTTPYISGLPDTIRRILGHIHCNTVYAWEVAHSAEWQQTQQRMGKPSRGVYGTHELKRTILIINYWPLPPTPQPTPVLSCTLTHTYPLSTFTLVRSNFV